LFREGFSFYSPNFPSPFVLRPLTRMPSPSDNTRPLSPRTCRKYRLFVPISAASVHVQPLYSLVNVPDPRLFLRSPRFLLFSDSTATPSQFLSPSVIFAPSGASLPSLNIVKEKRHKLTRLCSIALSHMIASFRLRFSEPSLGLRCQIVRPPQTLVELFTPQESGCCSPSVSTVFSKSSPDVPASTKTSRPIITIFIRAYLPYPSYSPNSHPSSKLLPRSPLGTFFVLLAGAWSFFLSTRSS